MTLEQKNRKLEELRQIQTKFQKDSQLIKELLYQVECLNEELQRKNRALRLSEAKRQKASRSIAELRSQLKHIQAELEREKAKKKRNAMSDSDFLKLCNSADAEKIEEAIMNGADVNAHNVCGQNCC